MNNLFTKDITPVNEESVNGRNADSHIDFVSKDFRAVVVGGGTGSVSSINALKGIGVQTDVVVTMADDGGSTGDLRKKGNCSAPGDVRKCLCALAHEADNPLCEIFTYRISKLNNHSLGNLILSALELSCGSFVDAIKKCEELLDCTGHVYPSTLERVKLIATTKDGTIINGQAKASNSNVALQQIKLINEQGEVPSAYFGTLDALENADLIVLGPGSLFTSIIPNIVIEEVEKSIAKSKAVVVFVCAIADCEGETRGLSVSDQLKALNRHGLAGRINYAIINSEQGCEHGNIVGRDVRERDVELSCEKPFRLVRTNEDDIQEIEDMGVHVVIRNMINRENVEWHNISALKSAFLEVLNEEFK